MAIQHKNKEFTDENIREKASRKNTIKDFLDGSLIAREIVIKNLPYIIFLMVLAIIYIGNRYHAERLIRESTELKKDVKDLRSEAITTEAELMFISKQSEVLKLINERDIGLIESREPPIILKVDEK